MKKKRARVISVISLKGGVGKTTAAVTTASALSDKNARCLLIDLDPSQANLTLSTIGSLWSKDSKHEPGICAAIDGDIMFKDIIKPTARENLYVIPSEKVDQKGRAYAVDSVFNNMNPADGIEAVSKLINDSNLCEEFDFIFIDTSPHMSMMAISALKASDYFIVPVQLSDFSIEGLGDTIDAAMKVKRFNPNLKALGFFVSSLDKRSKDAKESVELLKNYSKERGIHLFKTMIPVVSKIAHLPKNQKTILDVTKKTERGHAEYLSLATEMLRRVVELEIEQSKREQVSEV